MTFTSLNKAYGTFFYTLDVPPVTQHILKIFTMCQGVWVTQSVERQISSTQIMMSQFMSSSPMLGSALTAQSLEPASDSVSPSLSAPPPLMLCLCLSLSQK